ncbi:hypothetical protein TNCV_4380931 [Trichonephila clavipes]|nr:hypothetical protein TNCV_4380931 [Trichonephila clavipes]
MPSRHHIDDFMRGRIIGKIEEGRKKTTDVAKECRHRSQRSFTAVGSHLKLLECSRRHGGGRVRSNDARRRQIYRPISKKGTGAPQSSAGGKSVSCCLRKADLPETVARRLRGGGLYARRPVVCPIDQTAQYCPFAMVS